MNSFILVERTTKMIFGFQVNIVFHIAATVRFDENLKIALSINIKGTQDLLNMSREIKNLKSFVHVSTLFANCINNIIEEKFYPPALDYKQLMGIVNNLPANLLEKITPE